MPYTRQPRPYINPQEEMDIGFERDALEPAQRGQYARPAFPDCSVSILPFSANDLITLANIDDFRKKWSR
ncbi:hypothetical protein LZ554_002039 [Drepanopeziza brunnea f. sp. 'monogermtubi']|nr:hypothetical protein LZ554_002039 [Drepanopeziza brunnea f. sp. 'monogermtubi']